MSTTEGKPKILSVDDTPLTSILITSHLSEVGSVEILDSTGMNIAAAVEAIRLKLKEVDVLILDGNYEDLKKTKDQTALQIIQALAAELQGGSITVIVYSTDEEILTAVKTAYPSVSTLRKPHNFDSIKDAIKTRVPFQENQNI